MNRSRWKVLLQTRHFGGAYRALGLGFDDFEPATFSRSGDLEYPSGDYYASRDGRYRVSAFVDEWGHSCRLVEYAVGAVSLLELAEVYERLARRLRVEAIAEALHDARNPKISGRLRIISAAEIGRDMETASGLVSEPKS